MNEVRLNDLLELDPMDLALRNFLRPWRAAEGLERAPSIRLDVSETDDEYAVKAEIPGVRKEDIDIRVDGDQITISAEVKKDKEERQDGRVLRSERQYGFASRSFTLACDVDEAKADAKYDNGVLSLKLPKKAASASKRLSVA